MKLATAHQICVAEDKSPEYTIQFMIDMCKVDIGCVTNFLRLKQEEKEELYDAVNGVIEMVNNWSYE